MQERHIFNAGRIHDIPIGKGFQFYVDGYHFAIFRETYGKFYILEDTVLGLAGPISQGIIDRGRINLRYGKSIDLRTGQCDESENFIPTFPGWVENGFIFIEITNPVEVS